MAYLCKQHGVVRVIYLVIRDMAIIAKFFITLLSYSEK